MTVLKGILEPDGALVDVEIGWSDSGARTLRASLQPVPPPVRARAVLDSGAEATCVDASLIQSLGLSLSGVTPANLPAFGGLTLGVQRDASLTMLHPSGNVRRCLVVRTLLVIELSLSGLGFQVLIGRDVLSLCRFLFDGPRGRFKLGY